MADGIFIDEDWEMGEFKPCFIYNRELDLLQWINEDTSTVSVPVSALHAADILYADEEVRFLGIRLWWRRRAVGVQIWGALAAIKAEIGDGTL